ncbi:MAG: YraN family protein [Patescibacteria group bacterium]|nr:YraN family protein [Patescibacteria group bacterium]
MEFNKKDNKKTGNEGEDLAAEYLTKKKYKILGRNINIKVGEIDILAESRGTIVIVEVKTVRGSGFGLAQDLVRFKKQNKLKLLARALTQKYPEKTIRIDVIGIDYSFPEPKIEHIINAVY